MDLCFLAENSSLSSSNIYSSLSIFPFSSMHCFCKPFGPYTSFVALLWQSYPITFLVVYIITFLVFMVNIMALFSFNFFPLSSSSSLFCFHFFFVMTLFMIILVSINSILNFYNFIFLLPFISLLTIYIHT